MPESRYAPALAVFFRAVLRAVVFLRAAVFLPAAFPLALALGLAPRARLGAAVFADVGAALPVSGASASGAAVIAVGRSVTCTVRCAVRLTTRKARPIGAGRMRFCDGPWLA